MGELVKYNWERIIDGGSSDDIKCSNKKNTCERALCECDLDYAKKVILDLRFQTLRIQYRDRSGKSSH